MNTDEHRWMGGCLALCCFLGVVSMGGCGGSSDRSAERTEEEDQRPVGEATVGSDETGVREDVGGRGPEDGAKGDGVVDPVPPLRRWHDASGELLAVGEFIVLQGGNVCLQAESGEGIVIELERLSEADWEFVGGLSGEAASEEPVARDPPPVEDVSEPVDDRVAELSRASAGDDEGGGQKVVIPFDFVSKFDEGDYGQRVSEGIWTKLNSQAEWNREKGFVIPETLMDVRDLCRANGVSIGPETPLAEVGRVVTGQFDAQIGIWGSVERVPGHEWDVYDLVIKCVDFSGPKPKVIYERSARTEVVSEIPHLYRKEMLDALYGRPPESEAALNAVAEENWEKNPNLLAGDFQQGAGGVPAGWAAVGGHSREPLGGVVRWSGPSDDPGNDAGNKVIRFTFDKGVGNSSGVEYYSDFFPVEEGATYRFACRYWTDGPSMKVFIKCYDEMGSKYAEEAAAGAGSGVYVPEVGQRREVYRSQQNLKGPKQKWNVQTEDFTPEHTKYTPRWGRVMLYAYLGGGVVEWDDVVVKQILPAPAGETEKVLRHSMETEVTLEEMRDDEIRGKRAREKLREER